MVFLGKRDTGFWSRWWWTIDRYMLAAVAIITAIGMMLVMAASPAVAERIGLSSFHFVIRQTIFISIGVMIMLLFSLMSSEQVGRVSMVAFVGCIVFLILVKLMGTPVKGAQRWIYIGGFSLQPSEFVKPFLAVVTAWFLAKKNLDNTFPGFRAAIGVYLLVALLLLAQPDFGMTIAVTLVWATQMFLAGLSMSWVLALGGLGIAGIVSAYLLLPHVADRIDTFFNPTTGNNYQVAKSLEAFINGGFWGRGPGEGVVKHVIPDSHTDFIFAVAGEELGIVLCLFIVCVFAFIIIRGFIHLFVETDLFVIYATCGLLVQFGIQAMVNMGVTLGLLPNTGMTLPFISYGGSSTLAISVSVGMILGLTRRQYNSNVMRHV